MPNLEQVLEHVDIEHWERPTALLRLLTGLEGAGLAFAPLSPRLLQLVGRTAEQARYDHKVLVRLAARDRVLIRLRGSGRVPDAWHIADPRRWLHVPWITPRRDVMASLFFGHDDRNPIPLWGKWAGQPLRSGVSGPYGALFEELGRLGLSVNLHPSTERHHPSTERDAGEMGERSPLYGTAPSAPLLLTSNYTHSLSTLPLEPGREGVSEGAKALIAKVTQVIGCPVLGRYALRLAEIANAEPDRIPVLLEEAERLRGIKTASGAVAALEAALMHIPNQVTDIAPELYATNLRQRIANLRAFAPDDPMLAELEAELASMNLDTSASSEAS